MIYQLTGKITPKARPRLGQGRAYLPQNYRDWKEDAIVQLITQSLPAQPMTRAEVAIAIGGKQTGDLDNIAGAILDALVQAGVLLDDRISVVHKLSISHHRENPPGAEIELTDPTMELPNKVELVELLGNSPTAREKSQQRGYIGHIRPKTIKGHKYYYWIYYDRGKRVEKYMGTDLKGASKKARSIGICDE
jgi:Holliday junction resolvase RusA-like endonuclease